MPREVHFLRNMGAKETLKILRKKLHRWVGKVGLTDRELGKREVTRKSKGK